MEGVSKRAASMAAHLKLSKPWSVDHDSNHITIEGPTRLAFRRHRCTLRR